MRCVPWRAAQSSRVVVALARIAHRSSIDRNRRNRRCAFAPCPSRRPSRRAAPRTTTTTPRSAATTDAAGAWAWDLAHDDSCATYMGDCVRIIVGWTIDEWPCATLHGRLRAYYRVGETIDDEMYA